MPLAIANHGREEVHRYDQPALAREMIIRALEGGARASWVASDEVYGADLGLRAELKRRGTGYVLAVACSHQVTNAAGPQRAES